MEEASKHERETSPPGAQIPFAPPPPSSKKQRAFLADGYNAKWPNSEVIYDISDDIPDEKR